MKTVAHIVPTPEQQVECWLFQPRQHSLKVSIARLHTLFRRSNLTQICQRNDRRFLCRTIQNQELKNEQRTKTPSDTQASDGAKAN